MHNWVCWAAPLHDPVSGEQIGVIDLSTTWDRTHPIGLATARVLARLIEGAMPRSPPLGRRRGRDLAPPEPGLTLSLLGTAEAWLDGQRLLLNRRQTEILALLGLHPEGLSLERLHALVYGEHAVTLSTLKAEVSHLRAAVGGQLASRPYRLMMPVRTDVEDVLALLAAGDVRAAVAAYGGDLLPGTNAPALVRARRLPRGQHARGPARRPRTPPRCCATASWRPTTPRSSSAASRCSASATTPPRRCSRAGWRPQVADPSHHPSAKPRAPSASDPTTFVTASARLPSCSRSTVSSAKAE